MIPTGTLNHFARDIGVYDLREVRGRHRGRGGGRGGRGLASSSAAADERGARSRFLLNTASLGSYPDLVRLRERVAGPLGQVAGVRGRAGGHPASGRAGADAVRRQRWRTVWFLFVGNGPYHPRGAVPAWRSRLDSGLLDVRWVRADVRFSRLRAVCALLLAALGHSRVYGEALVRDAGRGTARTRGRWPATAKWWARSPARGSPWRPRCRSTAVTRATRAGPTGSVRTSHAEHPDPPTGRTRPPAC